MMFDDEKNESKQVYSPEQIENMKKIWEKYPRVEQPQDLNLKLFPHQLVTVHKMESLENERRVKVNDSSYYMTDFGILGDIPGYGKSMSVISLILRDNMPWDITKFHEEPITTNYNSSVKYVSKIMKRRVKANLLVVSPTLIEQWKGYFDFVKKDRLKIKEISQLKDFEQFNPNDWDLVLVSSVRYNAFIDQIGNFVWKRLIFDEAGSTHITAMRHVCSGFMWLVTATYRQLLAVSGNSQHYLRCFFKYFTPDILKHFVIKNPIEFVRYSFKMPEVTNIFHVCLNPRVLNVLSSYIDSETQLMLAAGDVRGAISRLGGASTNDSNLFEIVSKRQKEKLTNAKNSLEFWKGRGPIATKEIESWSNRVKELEKVIGELEEKYKNALKDDCTICYSPIEDPILIPCCQNVFCGKCIMKWLETKKTCPMCRSNVPTKDMIYINTGDIEEKCNGDGKGEKDEKVEEEKRPKQKQETVRDIIIDGLRNKKRFLIFSMYDESFYIIRRELEEHRINFVEISGSKATRDSKIKKFKEGKVNVVFLNSKFNGAGINLEMATDIILYHEMPPAIREQVIGRALRIGREEDLTVHNLVF